METKTTFQMGQEVGLFHKSRYDKQGKLLRIGTVTRITKTQMLVSFSGWGKDERFFPHGRSRGGRSYIAAVTKEQKRELAARKAKEAADSAAYAAKKKELEALVAPLGGAGSLTEDPRGTLELRVFQIPWERISKVVEAIAVTLRK